MEVILAEHAGFCRGVRRALKLTLDALQNENSVYMLGPLVHNESVIHFLQEKGVKLVDDLDEVKKGTLIVRTHGVSPDVLERIKNNRDITLIDATCSFVKRVQKLARDLSAQGFQVIIYGDPAHPEVVGLAGWAGDKALVIPPGGELSPDDFTPPTAVISQTTQDEEVFKQFVSNLKKVNPEVKVLKTICQASIQRQEAARRLAEKVELVLVIGGKDSSNTLKLTEACRQIVKTYQVTGPEEISSDWYHGVKTVGVTAGASTPDWTIKEVMEKMTNENMGAMNEESFPYAEEIKSFQVGEIVEGKVVQVEEDEILVDIGYKTEALLPRNEIFLEEGETLTERFKPGDPIELLIIKVNEEEGKIIVSQKRLEREKTWQQLETALKKETTMTGIVKEVVPAGIILNVGAGVEAFMPGSLVDLHYIPDFHQFIGQEFPFKVIELNRERDKVILSRKQVLEEEAENKKEETLKTLKEGMIVKGIVRRLTDFGAFVDVGGIDGLVHISEISWERVEHPQDVLKVGQEVEVKVLEVIPERERISLSIRQALPDPWEQVRDKFSAGEIVEGKVTRIVNFGAFVELMPGVEGLVHISQMADYHVKHPSEVVQEGEIVEVKILDLNPEAKRISLSLKEAASSSKLAPPKERETNDVGPNVTLGDVFGNLFEKENN